MDERTVRRLSELFRQRESLRRARDYAAGKSTSKLDEEQPLRGSIWNEVIRDHVGSGTISCVVDAVGGTDALRSALRSAAIDVIDKKIAQTEVDIKSAGGTP